MVIESITKNGIYSKDVRVSDVPVTATEKDVLRFVGMPPTGLGHSVTIADDFSGEVSGKVATVRYFTD